MSKGTIQNTAELQAWIKEKNDRIAQLKSELETVKDALRYLAYQRDGMGRRLTEFVSEPWQKKIYDALH